MASAGQRHVQDVGRIIMDVEKDLQGLREELSSAEGLAGSRLEEIISRAERELRQKADLVLSAALEGAVERVDFGAPSQQQYSQQQQQYSQQQHSQQQHSQQQHSQQQMVLYGEDEWRQQPQGTTVGDLLERKRSDAATAEKGGGRPSRPRGGRLAARRRPLPSSLSKLQRTDVRKSYEYLPPGAEEKRVPPVGDMSVIEMMDRGVVSRNADMTAAFTGGQAPVVMQNRAPMYQWANAEQRKQRQQISLSSDGQGLASNFRFDISGDSLGEAGAAPASPEHNALVPFEPPPEPSTIVQMVPVPKVQLELPRRGGGPCSPVGGGSGGGSGGRSGRAGRKRQTESLGQSVEKIRAYEERLGGLGMQVFLIRDGQALTRSAEFANFRNQYEHVWGPVSAALGDLERLLVKYSVPIAHVDGRRLAQLATDELRRHEASDLLACVRNADQVAGLVKLPGRQFAAGDGSAVTRAAVAVQSTFRGYNLRRKHFAMLRRHGAARAIQAIFRVHVLRKALKNDLQVRRGEDEAKWTELCVRLQQTWASTKSERRTIVHVPSMSHAEHLRLPVEHLKQLENSQMVRLGDLKDPLVDLVYVCPFPVPADLRSYYSKLLEIAGVTNFEGRLRFVWPENAERFPEHFSLSTVLYYSPVAMAKIRKLCEGRPAFLVGGQVGEEDRTLAVALNLPLFGPTPELSAFYGSKSGAKRAFAEAQVSMPLGAHDIYEHHELVSALAKLIAANLDMQSWLLKIDDEFGGRGHATVDLSKIRLVQELRRERSRQAAKAQLQRAFWGRPEVQDGARQRLEAALRTGLKSATTVWSPQVYPTWDSFVRSFLRVGGVIEAIPHEVISSPSVNLLIEPGSEPQVISTQEQHFGRPNRFKAVGFSFPQRTLPHSALAGAARAVARVLAAKGVVGYVGIDFLAFRDAEMEAVRLWAVDINLRITTSCAAFRLFDLLMQGGVLDGRTGLYSVPNPARAKAAKEEEAKQADAVVDAAAPEGGAEERDAPANTEAEARAARKKARKAKKASAPAPAREARVFVAMDALHHPNLSTMPYASFFNMCRLHGVSFDLFKMRGITFNLSDSLAAGVVGTLSVASTEYEARNNLHRGLKFIHKQAGGYTYQKRLATPPNAGPRPREEQPWDGTTAFYDALSVTKALIEGRDL